MLLIYSLNLRPRGLRLYKKYGAYFLGFEEGGKKDVVAGAFCSLRGDTGYFGTDMNLSCDTNSTPHPLHVSYSVVRLVPQMHVKVIFKSNCSKT